MRRRAQRHTQRERHGDVITSTRDETSNKTERERETRGGLVGKKPVFPFLQSFFFIPPVVGPEQFFYTFRNDFCAPHDASFFFKPRLPDKRTVGNAGLRHQKHVAGPNKNGTPERNQQFKIEMLLCWSLGWAAYQ